MTFGLYPIISPPKVFANQVAKFALTNSRSLGNALGPFVLGAVTSTFVVKYATGVLAKTGNAIQLRFWNPSASNVTITRAYVGVGNNGTTGSPWDFSSGGGTQVTFGGSTSLTLVPGYGNNTFSDQIAFATSANAPLTIAFDVPVSQSVPAFSNLGDTPLPSYGVGSNAAGGLPCLTYYKTGVNEASSTTKSTGYSLWLGGGAGVWAVWVAQT